MRETPRVFDLMGKHRHKLIYILLGIAILLVACMLAYRWRSSRSSSPKRSPPLAPAGLAEQAMLQGKFSKDISAEQRKIVADELQASDQPSQAEPAEPISTSRGGTQQITPTQPVGTTVEDTQPTLTWDAMVDGWRYRIRLEDESSPAQAITSPILDEAMWGVAAPLTRGHAYIWRVEAMPAGSRTTATSVTSALAQFKVLSEEGEREIQNARAQNAPHLLLGSLYTHHGMWREAVLEYRKMVEEVPDSPDAIRLLRNAERRASSKMGLGSH